MSPPEGSTWRCSCGEGEQHAATSYMDALRALREHQSVSGCKPGRGDRIRSRRDDNETQGPIEVETSRELHGPPRPSTAFKRREREGLSWLPQSGASKRR